VRKGGSPADAMALYVIDADGGELIEHGGGFHAFGNGFLAKNMGYVIHGSHHGEIEFVVADVLYVRPIQFQIVGR